MSAYKLYCNLKKYHNKPGGGIPKSGDVFKRPKLTGGKADFTENADCETFA
jgi:hypothetical protein